MNSHLLIVLYAGGVFLASGACLLEISRLLGKTFETKVSAPWWVRGAVFAGAVTLFGYGCVILFPGRAISVQHMSLGLPAVGTVVLGMALWLLDHVTGEREPPPWSVDFLRLVALLGWDSLLKGAAFKTRPAAYLDPLPPSGPASGRLVRVAVLVGAVLTISAIACVILLNSAAA